MANRLCDKTNEELVKSYRGEVEKVAAAIDKLIPRDEHGKRKGNIPAMCRVTAEACETEALEWVLQHGKDFYIGEFVVEVAKVLKERRGD